MNARHYKFRLVSGFVNHGFIIMSRSYYYRETQFNFRFISMKNIKLINIDNLVQV